MLAVVHLTLLSILCCYTNPEVETTELELTSGAEISSGATFDDLVPINDDKSNIDWVQISEELAQNSAEQLESVSIQKETTSLQEYLTVWFFWLLVAVIPFTAGITCRAIVDSKI